MTWLRQFLFPRRLHRVAFFLRYFVVQVAAGALGSVITTSASVPEDVACVLLLAYYGMFVVLPRLRDLKMSTWWVIAAFIPIVGGFFGIILLFRAPAWFAARGVAGCDSST